MDKTLKELAVVHGAHTGYQSQHRRGRRIGAAGGRRNKGLLIALPCQPARLTEKLPSGRIAHAAGAERFAAALAIGGCAFTNVIYAVHTVLLSRIAFTEPPESAGRA